MRALLFQHWAQYRNLIFYQPLDQIRIYLGEQIALYFAWLGFYNLALLYASIFGLIVFLFGLGTYSDSYIVKDYCDTDVKNTIMCPQCDERNCSVTTLSSSCLSQQISSIFDNNLSMAYGIIMSLWSALFIEFWKRRTFKLTYDWDLTDIDEDGEPARPRYRAEAAKRGTLRPNPVTLRDEKYISRNQRFKKKLVSSLVVLVGLVTYTVLSQNSVII